MKKCKRKYSGWFFTLLLGLLCSSNLIAQQATLSGQITDKAGEPLIGASVIIKGTTIGTMTDTNGNFTLRVPVPADAVMVVTYIGYVSQEASIGGRTSINVVLIEDVSLLEEVVVTGYQVQRKVDLTGSVSVVKIDNIKDNPSGNPLKALSGRIPGVYIQTDGSPSGNIRTLYIRGINTLGNTNPLYIIDGVPTTDSKVFQNIDPNAISSIQVLKDASAASIYGSRASNGVIIITTKEGQQTPTIRFTSSFSTQSHMRRLDMSNTQEFGEALWQATINDNRNPNIHSALYSFESHTDGNGIAILDRVIPVPWIGGSESLITPSANTDWQDEVFRTGLISSNSLTFSTGTKASKLLIDLTYYSNNGIVINNNYKRISTRINSSVTLLKDRLKFGENVQISTDSEIPVPNDMGGASVLSLATTILPILPVYKTDGTFSGPIGSGFSDRSNPVHISEINKDDRNNNFRVFGNLYADLTIIKNLLFRSNFGIEYNMLNQRNIERTFSTGFLTRTVNSLAVAQATDFNWTWSNTLNYNLSTKEHSANFLLGMEAINKNYNAFGAKREGFALEDTDYYYLNAGTGVSTNSGSATGSKLLSYFGKTTYAFKEKYLASATLRYDGSSRFGSDNVYALFPSASVGWIMSRESFMANTSPIISFLKLRVGVGRVGNQEIGDNARFALFATNYGTMSFERFTGTAYDINGVGTGNLPSGYVKTQTENSKLKWETTDELNTGIDVGFLDQRITASFDYFMRETRDILIRLPYPAVVGEGGFQYVNGATVQNNGFEIDLGFNGSIEKLGYNITGSISHFADKVTYLPPQVITAYGGNIYNTILGHSRTSYFGYITDGIFQTQQEVDDHVTQAGKNIGRIKYMNLNEDATINALDQDWIGHAIPKFEYGVNIALTYEGFMFSTFLHGVQGVTVNDASKNYTDFMGTTLGVNKGTRLLNAWTPQNTESTIPMLSLTNANNELRTSDYFLVNGSYFKIANMQISYSLPAEIVSKAKISETRIFLMGENFLLLKDNKGKNAFTGPDPETPGSIYPHPVTITIGLDVKF